MADTRKLKVYEAWGRNYRSVPEIILKGDWLKQYGFTEDTPIHVHCEDGKLTITPRDPDPVPDLLHLERRIRLRTDRNWFKGIRPAALVGGQHPGHVHRSDHRSCISSQEGIRQLQSR